MRQRKPDQVVRDIGRRIAELRMAKGWTQEDLAEALGIAVQGGSGSLSCSPVKAHRRHHGRNASTEVVQAAD